MNKSPDYFSKSPITLKTFSVTATLEKTGEEIKFIVFAPAEKIHDILAADIRFKKTTYAPASQSDYEKYPNYETL